MLNWFANLWRKSEPEQAWKRLEKELRAEVDRLAFTKASLISAREKVQEGIRIIGDAHLPTIERLKISNSFSLLNERINRQLTLVHQRGAELHLIDVAIRAGAAVSNIERVVIDEVQVDKAFEEALAAFEEHRTKKDE